MKLLTCRQSDDSTAGDGAYRLAGLLSDGRTVVFLDQAAVLQQGSTPPEFAQMIDLLRAGQAGMQNALRVIDWAEANRPETCLAPLDQVRLAAPVPRPESLRDCLSYERHLTQAMSTVARQKWRAAPWLNTFCAKLFRRPFLRPPAVWYERPLYYKGNPRSVVGHGADVHWPAYAKRLDFELEFGVFLGREGKNIAPAEAETYIAGYSLFNDFSARDMQLREMQGRLGPAKGKDFDTGNAIGPYLVTPDEIPDPYDLTMRVRVNDQVWSETHSGDIQHRLPEIISFISQDETLHPGDFLAVGTLPGGCGLELNRWIQVGDVVSLECEELGVLKNRIVR